MNANSVVTVLPNTNPPACLMRATHCASCSGRWPAYTGEPICVGSSDVAMMSLTPMPQPASAPRACCESQRCASSRTCAASRCAHASIASSVASMRASCDTANAGAVASPEAIARSGRRKRSVLMPSLCLVRAARDGQCHDARLWRGPRTLRRPQEDRLQIVQESTAALGGLQYCRVGVEEAARDRLRDLALDRREREAGPLGEQRCGHAFGEPKRIQHELEARVVARDFRFLEQRCAERDLNEILLRLLVSDLPHDALGERELRMRACANAQIIAEAPIIEIVPALATRARERRCLVMNVAGARERVVHGVLDIGGEIVVGQRRRMPVEQRVRLERQLIERKVRWSESNR